MFLAKIYVTLKPTVNDPQGETVLGALKSLGFNSVDSVRVGKYMELKVAEGERKQAERRVREMCDKLLANPVIEEFHFELQEMPDNQSS